MTEDRITITEPNGVERTRPVTSRRMTIGREYGSDLVIAYPVVSRTHALITFENGSYYVTDLGSANGTYLNDARLEPNVPTLWRPAQVLRISEVTIRLTQTASAARATATGETMFMSAEQIQEIAGVSTKRRLSLPVGVWIALAAAAVVVVVLVILIVVLLVP